MSDYAFRDNELTHVDTKNIESIGLGSFQNNKITDISLGNSLKSLGEGAFRTNDLSEVSIPASVTSFGSKLFIDNNRYVRITGDNTIIQTERVDSHYGHVVNSSVVTVKFLDKETEKEILSPKVLGEDLSVEGEIFEIGKTANYTAPKIEGYLAVKEQVEITPKSSNDTVEIYYINSKKPPVITAPGKSFKPTDTIDASALLKDVKAVDLFGKDISGRITVSPESLDASTPGFFDITYSVTDDYGNTNTKTVKVAIEQDWSKMEVGGGWVVGDFTYSGQEVTGFSATGKEKLANNKDLYVPMVNGNGDSVTGVAVDAFRDNQLTSVVIPDGVNSIRSSAFRYNKLTSVVISDSVTNIGDWAFQNNQLTSVVIPDSVTTIESCTFQNNQLTFVVIGNSVKSIGWSAFRSNKLTSAIIPDSVTSIGDYAFCNNKLTSVIIPDSVNSIGDDAFGNNQLTSIVIPDSVTSIGSEAFSDNRLTSVVIPDSVTSIGSYAFFRNKLTSVVISNSVTRIGDGAFRDNQLTSVVIPDRVMLIGSEAFRNNQLTSVVIPDSVRSIGNEAFRNNAKSPLPAHRDNYPLNKLDSNAGLIYNSYKATGNEDVEWTMDDFLWDGDTVIGLKNIAKEKLDRSSKLIIPDGAKAIGQGAFRGLNLTSVVIPDSVMSIGAVAFEKNKLTSVIIPDSVTRIGHYAFYANSKSPLPAYNENYPIHEYDNDANLIYNPYVANGNEDVEWARDDFLWDGDTVIGLRGTAKEKLEKSSKLVVPDRTKAIGNYAFNFLNLTSVVIPDSVTSIGNGSFYNNQLTSVTIPNSVTSIGNTAFHNNKLTSVVMGNSVTNIGSDAFYSNQLTSVVIPDSVTSIGDRAFMDNQLTSVVIGNSVTIIGYRAFQDNKLTSVTIPDSVTNIGEFAFSNNKLTYVVIGNNVTSIKVGAFRNNAKLPLPAHRDNYPLNKHDRDTDLIYNPYKANGNEDVEWTRDDFLWDGDTVIGFKGKAKEKLDRSSKLIIPDGTKAIREDAFRDLNLTSVVIPDSVTNIGWSAFRHNQLTSVVIGNSVTSVGYWAFENNQLTSVVIPDSVTSIGWSAFQYNPGVSTANYNVVINIKDSNGNKVNPNNLTNEQNYIINPKYITINYINEKGEPLLSQKEIIEGYGNSRTLSAEQNIAGYITPSDITVNFEKDKYNYTVDFVYKKIPEEELTKLTNKAKSIKFEHKSVEDKNYYIGDTMVSRVYFDLSGFDSNLKNYKIKLFYNPEIFDKNKIKVTPAQLISKSEVKDGVVELTLADAYGGSSLSLPIEWAFNKYKTPENTPHFIQAAIYDSEDKLYALTEDTKFIGHYNNPNLEKELTGETNGYVVTDDIDEDGYLTGDKLLEYRFKVTNIERNIGEYKVIDTLPEYKNRNNETVKATFSQDENPEWKLNEDGNTVTYVGNANNSTNLTIPSLKLRMPGAQSYANIRNTANVEAAPYEMSKYEKPLTASDYVTHYFKKPEVYIWTPTPPSPPPAEWTGVAFDKDIRMPHYASSESQAYFYDVDGERNTDFAWTLPYKWRGRDVQNISITDKNLDERMYYSAIIPTDDFIGGEIQAFDKDGNTVELIKIENTEKIIFNPRTAENIAYINISKKDINKSVGYGEIIVYTRLKNVENTIYDDTPGSKKNVFENTAVADYTLKDGSTISIVSKDNIALRWLTQTIKAAKSTTFSDENHYVRDTGSYFVGCATDSPMIVDDMKDFELVDLLPNGINVTNIEFLEPFNSEPTKSYQVIENYNNSGQTAIIFKADKLKFEKTSKNTMNIAKIDVEIDDLMPTGTFTNEVFLRVSNPDFKIHNTVEDNRIGEGKYSKASVSNKVLKAEELIARKYIKKASSSFWSKTGIFTDSLEKFEYKLTIFNGTPKDRTNVQIIDILPYVGDTSLTANEKGEYISRESEFANTFDYEKGVQAPEGYEVYYLNTPWQGMTDTMDNLDKALNWEKTPTKDTSAVKLVAKDGVILKGYSQLDVIIPMVAPENSDLSLSGQRAWNTYVRKDTNTIRFIEPNRVYNEMSIPKGTITLTKKGLGDDWKSLVTLKGAVFDLRDKDGNFIKSATSDENGLVTFDDLDLLKDYTIVERTAPEGYVKSDKEITVLGKDILAKADYKYDAGMVANKKRIVPLEPIVGDVKLIKTDKNDEPLSGAKFNIVGQDNWNKEVSRYAISDTRGKVQFLDLPVGHYILTETEAPGNLTPIKPIKVSIGSNKQVVDLGRIKNDIAEITVTKVGINKDLGNQEVHKFNGDTLAKLQNAVFSLYKGDTLISENLTTDKNGQIKLTGLEVEETYKLVETKIPDKYLKIYDEILFKVDKHGRLLTENNEEFGSNSIIIPNLRAASIKLTKLGILPEHQDKKLSEFKGIEGSRLGGAEFAVYNGDVLVQEGLLTDSKGELTLDNLDYGVTYTIKETKPPKDYLILHKEIQVQINIDKTVMVNGERYTNSALYVPNLKEEKESKVIITKVDSKTNDKLEGAVFRLTKEVRDPYAPPLPPDAEYEYTLVDEKTTDANGTVSFENLKEGTYKIEEVKAPNGYKKDSKTYTFVAEKYFEKTFSYTFTNTPLSFDLMKISYIARAVGKAKADELKAANDKYVVAKNKLLYDVYLPLSGVKFDVINTSNNEIVESVISGEGGVITLNPKLYDMDNNYRIIEKEAPEGYELNRSGWDINLAELQKQSDFTGEIKMVLNNRPLKGQLIVSKYDRGKKTTIPGVEFTLYDVNEEKIKTLVTDGHGLAKFDNLDIGSYYIEETKPAEGYQPKPGKKKIEITKDALVQTYVMYNRIQFPLPITGLSSAGLITTIVSSLIAIAFVLNNKKKKLKN